MVAGFALAAAAGQASEIAGTVSDDRGPVVGAMVTFQSGDPIHAITVYSDERGAFRTPPLSASQVDVRVRRIGWKDLRRAEVAVAGAPLVLTLEREEDPAALAEQLPAHRWLPLVTNQLQDETEREQFVRQCTYCHQQGNRATRVPREDWQWEKVLNLMARMGGVLTPELRAKVPELFRRAYDPATAVTALVGGRELEDLAPPPVAEARRAVIEEWELGGRASMQHDLAFHPDGRAYSVDMAQDRLYRLDPATGEMASFPIADEGLGLGGVFGGEGQPLPSTANARQGPHSLQFAPDGDVWITFALGNQIGRFDHATETWTTYPLDAGYYPHTLRFDAKGRVWFTLAISNHLGMFDPATERFETIRLPAGSFVQDIALRLLPAMLWLAGQFGDDAGLGGESGDPDFLPVPYGIDVGPDGSIWFSQLNQHRIGRVDPETLDVEMVDTPFPAPRRLRFDSANGLWIPSFSTGKLARFDVVTREFREWVLPTAKEGVETPYSVHVNRRNDEVWVCGTNSDTLMRFDPKTERFVVYPLPTRVTYTRDIDFDAQGRVWTSNSNAPTWQVEGGFPRVLRLDPRDPAPEVAGGSAP
ncbi:MAG: hypothetical protein CL910_20055 [Deltaproteobacteria bacterium]|nr:hypothetical protein [Deltaproteobacteria bacterium]